MTTHESQMRAFNNATALQLIALGWDAEYLPENSNEWHTLSGFHSAAREIGKGRVIQAVRPKDWNPNSLDLAFKP